MKNKIQLYTYIKWSTLMVWMCSLVSCSDELALPESSALENPVFQVEALIDGQNTLIQAGEDNYLMSTDFNIDDDTLLAFQSRFDQVNCGNQCWEELFFEFRSAVSFRQSSFSIDEALILEENYLFSPVLSDTMVTILGNTFEVGFQNTSYDVSTSPAFPTEWLWTFENGNTDTAENPTLTYEDPGVYSVCLQMTNLLTGGSVCTIENCKEINLESNTTICNVDIVATQDSSTSNVILQAIPEGSAAFTFLWSDNSTGSTTTVSPNTPISSYCVTVTTANGCTAETCIVVDFIQGGFIPVYCYAGFDYVVEEIKDSVVSVIPGQLLGTVVIGYQAEDGTVYRSDMAPEEPSGTFQILSIEPYEDNENRQPTVKAEIVFSGTLYSSTGESIEIDNGAGVIGVAHPE